jgi:predicted nuclease of predicted toxin-antitoxin system
LRFLVDAQLPPALARYIESRGHKAEHVADLGLERAADSRIRATATDLGAVIITKDEDFGLHLLLHGGPSVVWVQCGGVTSEAGEEVRAHQVIKSWPWLALYNGSGDCNDDTENGFQHGISSWVTCLQ